MVILAGLEAFLGRLGAILVSPDSRAGLGGIWHSYPSFPLFAFVSVKTCVRGRGFLECSSGLVSSKTTHGHISTRSGGGALLLGPSGAILELPGGDEGHWPRR